MSSDFAQQAIDPLLLLWWGWPRDAELLLTFLSVMAGAP